MAFSITAAIGGAAEDWLKRDNLRINAAAKEREKDADRRWEEKKLEIAHGYRMDEIDHRNAKEATTNAVDPNFVFGSIPQKFHQQLTNLGVQPFAETKDVHKARYGTGPKSHAFQVSWLDNDVSKRIIQSNIEDENNIGMNAKLARSILEKASISLQGGKLTGAQYSQNGAIIKGRRTLGTYPFLSRLSMLYGHTPEAQKYKRLFEYQVEYGPAIMSNPHLRKIAESTQLFRPPTQFGVQKGTVRGPTGRVQRRETVDVEGQPSYEEIPEMGEIPYNVHVGRVSTDLLLTATRGLVGEDLPKMEPKYLDFAGVKKDSPAYNGLKDTIVNAVHTNELGTPEIKEGDGSLPALGYFSNLVLLGRRDFEVGQLTRDGEFSSHNILAPQQVEDRVKNASREFSASRDLIVNVERTLSLNQNLQDNIEQGGAALENVTAITEVMKNIRGIFGAISGSDYEKPLNKQFSDANIDAEFKDVKLRNFMKEAVSKIHKQRLKIPDGSSKEFVRLAQEYSFMKVRLVFTVAKQIQGGTGGRGVSDADFRNVLESFGSSVFGTLGREKSAFKGLLDMTKKQYVYSYFSQMPSIRNLSTLEDMTNRTMDLDKANMEKITEKRMGISEAPSKKEQESSEVIDALQ